MLHSNAFQGRSSTKSRAGGEKGVGEVTRLALLLQRVGGTGSPSLKPARHGWSRCCGADNINGPLSPFFRGFFLFVHAHAVYNIYKAVFPSSLYLEMQTGKQCPDATCFCNPNRKQNTTSSNFEHTLIRGFLLSFIRYAFFCTFLRRAICL